MKHVRQFVADHRGKYFLQNKKVQLLRGTVKLGEDRDERRTLDVKNKREQQHGPVRVDVQKEVRVVHVATELASQELGANRPRREAQ
eukprot:5186467-Pleurochrysis_carterae.AAC.1